MPTTLFSRRDLGPIFRCAALTFAMIVAWFAFRPATDVEAGLAWDKANHALAFLVLTILTSLGWPTLSRQWVFVLMLAAGVFVELVQGLPMIGRDADIMDVVADGVGAMAGLFVLMRLSHRQWNR